MRRCGHDRPNGQGLWPHLGLMLGIAVVGGVLGDLVWFQGGRRYGDRTLKTICKLSLSRDTCVKKTERFFGQWDVRTCSFIAHDGVGVALWAAVGLAVGVIFAAELDMVFAMIARHGKQALLVVAVALACYVAYHRYWRRKMLMKTLETVRIMVDELYSLMANEPLPAIFDIRSAEKRVLNPFVNPGSVFADERELQKIVESYQPDQKIVIYCSCPNEVSAAWMAKALRNAGFKDVVSLTDFGGAREDLGEMAAMCPWSAKALTAGKGALHDAVYLHGDRHA